MPSERTTKAYGRRPRPFVRCYSSSRVECEMIRVIEFLVYSFLAIWLLGALLSFLVVIGSPV